MAYGLGGTNHLGPLVLAQHADVAMLHTTPPFSFVATEVTSAGSSKDLVILRLLQSTAYGLAHGW